MLFAVNGTLMRGQSANPILVGVGATFMRDDSTAPIYRLWSVGDNHPGMLRDENGGASIALEIWEITSDGLIKVLENEPPGLSVGRILMADSTLVAGILAEPYIVEEAQEITKFGGWREYIDSKIR